MAAASAAPAVPAEPMVLKHIAVTPEMLFDVSLFASMAVCFLLLGLLVSKERRRGLFSSAVVSVLMLAGLWALANFGHAIADATIYDIAREGMLAMLAFAVIRSTLLFLGHVLLGRLHLPKIVTDVLLTIALIVYALFRMNVVGVNLAGILTTSAVLTGAIAFSGSEILGALWAGLALQGERTLRQGDWIRYGEKLGQVVQLRWRSTAIATCDHETIIIPNTYLMKDKIQLVGRHGDDASNQRRHVHFSVSYDTPPNEVIRAVNESLRRNEIHNVAHEPPPFCVCKAFSADGVDYEALYHIHDLHHYLETDSAVLTHLFATLQRNDMTIPFPQRVIHSASEDEARRRGREHERRLSLIDQVPLFASLSDDERETLAGALAACPLVRDEVLFRQGEQGDSLYVVASGRLHVVDESAGARRQLAELAAPAYFGERGLLLGQPRGATIMAAEDAFCYRLDKARFDAIVRARPGVIEDLSAVLAQRQAENDAKLQSLDAEARAKQASRTAADFVRRIRGFFGVDEDEQPATARHH